MSETFSGEFEARDEFKSLIDTFMQIRDPEVRTDFVRGIKETDRLRAAELYQTDVPFQIDVVKMIKDCCHQQWYEVAEDIGKAMGVPDGELHQIIEQQRGPGQLAA